MPLREQTASKPRSESSAPSTVTIFTFPNRILFGLGSRSRLAKELSRLGVSRPLIVTDAGLERTGIVSEIVGNLGGATVFNGVQANPTEADVQALSLIHI